MLSILLKDTGIARIYLQLNFTINVSYKPTTKISGNFYRPQRSWGKVIFSEACVKISVHRGEGEHGTGAWVAGGGMHGGSGRRACVVGGMPGRGVCVAGGMYMAGGMHGVDMHGRGGVCGSGRVWQILRDTVNERAVHILLECILVLVMFSLRILKRSRKLFPENICAQSIKRKYQQKT